MENKKLCKERRDYRRVSDVKLQSFLFYYDWYTVCSARISFSICSWRLFGIQVLKVHKVCISAGFLCGEVS